MIPVPERYDTSRPGRPVARLEVWSRMELVDTLDLADDESVVKGSVTEKRVNGSRWSMSMEVRDTKRWREWLKLPRLEVCPYLGMSWGQSEWVTAKGTFPVLPVGWSRPSRTLTLQCSDRWQRIKRAEFYGPVVSYVGRHVDMIEHLVHDVDTGPGRLGVGEIWPDNDMVNTATSQASLAWPVIWTGREKTLLDLASAIGAELFFDGWGHPVLRDQVITPGVDLREGEKGTLVEVSSATGWGDVANVVIVTGTSAGSDFRGEARIMASTNPAHPDRIGEAVVQSSSSLITSQEQAQQAAAADLVRLSRPGITYSAKALADPSREAGDGLYLWPAGRDEAYVTVESVTHEFLGVTQSLALSGT